MIDRQKWQKTNVIVNAITIAAALVQAAQSPRSVADIVQLDVFILFALDAQRRHTFRLSLCKESFSALIMQFANSRDASDNER